MSNSPFPVRAKYVWNACVGVSPCFAGLGHSTGVLNDFVMHASVNTRIYMVLMENIAILLASMQCSPYTGKPRGLAGCVRLRLLCGEITIPCG